MFLEVVSLKLGNLEERWSWSRPHVGEREELGLSFHKVLRLYFLPREGDRGRSIRTRKYQGASDVVKASVS